MLKHSAKNRVLIMFVRIVSNLKYSVKCRVLIALVRIVSNLKHSAKCRMLIMFVRSCQCFEELLRLLLIYISSGSSGSR